MGPRRLFSKNTNQMYTRLYESRIKHHFEINVSIVRGIQMRRFFGEHGEHGRHNPRIFILTCVLPKLFIP